MYRLRRHKHTHHSPGTGLGSRRSVYGLADGLRGGPGQMLRVVDRVLPARGGWLSECGGGGTGGGGPGSAAGTSRLGRGGGGAVAAGGPLRAGVQGWGPSWLSLCPGR